MSDIQSMNLRDPRLISESSRYCRQLSKGSASSFVGTFAFLGLSRRRAMYALYAFMRFTDDLVDAAVDHRSSASQDPASASIFDLPPQDRLRHWRSALRLAFPASSSATDETPLQNGLHGNLSSEGLLIIPSLIDAVERFQIPTDCLFQVIDGVEMDLTKNRYDTFDELEKYCERVASAVGLACVYVWRFDGRGGPEEAEVLELARKVGIAYQLTNILRDIKEDAATDRIYLPGNEIAAAGYSVEELKHGVVNAAFEKLMRDQIERTEEYYRASRLLYPRLFPLGQRVFGMMTAMYHAILRQIAANPAAVFVTRVRPRPLERLQFLFRWGCFPRRDFEL
jgi:15-cis-phytoene synthase